ncbi:MAG: cytochrome c oxidase assembly protein [Chloroflexota bacterium]|nr:cytochrome c oxidase assembly protein [Chloroflexota bacterium]
MELFVAPWLLAIVAPPVLHGDPRLLVAPWWTTWRIDPTVGIGSLGLAAAYLIWTGPLNRKRPDAAERTLTPGQRIAFLLGCLTLLIALGPPIEDWAQLLLTGHMVQHLLLTMVVPPLLLFGTPAWLLRPLLRYPLVARAGYVLTRPVVALGLSGLAFIIWHLPRFYDAALASEPIHIAEHQIYLVTGILAWWPLLGPLPEWPRPAPLLQCLYLAAQTLPGGIVGSFITVAEPGLYRAYSDVPRMWGLDLATDQEIAGLLMWVGANAIYLLLITIIFFRWAGREDEAERGPARSSSGERATRY